ncbi:MAG: glycerophosphodiester phosphodiesterase [Sphaerochaeta sp.]|jgi:glycerophosphoryl diester phosphodiesterase|nr:glycerophosphodiester phosphodiesterase [Sphaerochaeta sp.]MDX9915504.1 glycerophosphodiester phosphodiesterase [Sphaerochaeta sp.]
MKIYAHRGASGFYPENTMLAFHQALEAKSDGIELDVQLSKDGHVVIIHDEGLERTTDATGRVYDYTLQELQRVNAAAKWQGGNHFHPIPTFDEYCSWVRTTDLITNIEIKSSVIYYPGLEKKTLDLIKAHKIEDRVIISSFNHLSLIETKRLAPDLPCGVLVPESGLVNAGYAAKHFGFEYFHPAYANLDGASVAECHRHSIAVNVWTVNTMEALEKCHAWGCDGIFTNYPKVARAYVDCL